MTGQLIGLDYDGVRAATAMLGLEMAAADFGKVRVLEHEMMTLLRRPHGHR